MSDTAATAAFLAQALESFVARNELSDVEEAILREVVKAYQLLGRIEAGETMHAMLTNLSAKVKAL